jgi:hypothetical protein
MFESYESESSGYSGQGEYFGEFNYESGGPFSEVEEMEMAAQLLEVMDEGELDQFLGKLIKKAGSAVGKFVKSDLGRSVGGLIKGAAKQALPMVGSALGNMVLPGLGGAAGAQLATAAGGMFGLELEGLSPQDQEFEVARRFVRFAGEAAKNAALAAPNSPAAQAARAAVIEAAQKHAPGLLQQQGRGRHGNGNGQQEFEASEQSFGQAQGGGGQQTGRWVRRGRKIILLGA